MESAIPCTLRSTTPSLRNKIRSTEYDMVRISIDFWRLFLLRFFVTSGLVWSGLVLGKAELGAQTRYR